MLKNILTVLRKLASAAMNFLIVYFETIAVPMSWAMGGIIMFTMYTELSNIFNGAVCLLVGLWQLGCIFTGRELPLWLKRLKFISTSCLAMTLLTVVIILAPMYEDGNGWYIMLCTSSMLYHHLLNPLAAIFSFCPKFAELIHCMPAATIGGVSLILYGMISAVGVRNVVENQVDFAKSRNVIIAAMIMSLALGIHFSKAGAIVFTVGQVTVSLSGLAVASLVGILLNAVLPGNDYVFGKSEQGDQAVNFKV